MNTRSPILTRRRSVAAAAIAAVAVAVQLLAAQPSELAPLRYTIRFPDPASKTFTIDLVVPTESRETVDLMMPVWSPGFYGRQNYADRVTEFSAGADGSALQVTKTRPNRWTVDTGGAASFTFSYTLSAPRGTNLSNGVTETSAVIVGPATYLAPVETAHRRVELRIELPAPWHGAMTSLESSADGEPNHFTAPDYDVLVDSPILAGADLTTTEFTAGGATHYWTYLGKAEWDGGKIAAAITPLIEEHRRFWGELPFSKYAFLNIVTGGGGGSGVEHLNSVAITTSGKEPADATARFRNAAFISHEYFHAVNVKRLRPVELGPFDYETPPVTTGLWIAEGLTSYFGDLLAARAGMGSTEDYLNICSRHITDLQTKQPGRLLQTLEQASAQMFDRIPAEQKVDYYVKGPVVGLILDAHIRRITNDRKSLDDVMRLEYKRWSGERGYTAEQFAQTASEAAGIDLQPLLRTLVGSTAELDYAEMLDWFGLRFVPNDPAKAWTLEVSATATMQQRRHLAAFLARSGRQDSAP